MLETFNASNTFCINLDYRTDRLDAFKAECNRINLSFSKYSAKQMIPPSMGAAMSHYNLWQKALKDNINPILILEDDVVFSDNFVVDFEDFIKEVPSDWLILPLGPFKIEQFSEVSANVRRSFSPWWGAHAYILNNKAVKILIETFNPRCPVDHALWEKFAQRNEPIYFPSHHLCYQSGIYSDINETAQTAFYFDTCCDSVKHNRSV